MMVLAMRAARVTTSVMRVILPRGRDLLPICPSQPAPRGLNTVGSLSPSVTGAAPALSPRFRRLTAAHGPLDSRRTWTVHLRC